MTVGFPGPRPGGFPDCPTLRRNETRISPGGQLYGGIRFRRTRVPLTDLPTGISPGDVASSRPPIAPAHGPQGEMNQHLVWNLAGRAWHGHWRSHHQTVSRATWYPCRCALSAVPALHRASPLLRYHRARRKARGKTLRRLLVGDHWLFFLPVPECLPVDHRRDLSPVQGGKEIGRNLWVFRLYP